MAVAPTAARGCRSFFIFGGAQRPGHADLSDVNTLLDFNIF